jgi:Zn-dependent M28 family amino/carboxypeptidase
MRHVRHLAEDIGVRVRTTEGETRGARYVAGKFRNYGYDVTIQRFSVDGATSRNVVARWPDANPYEVVIGGHMDSVPTSPGANDNASGTAVVLELAKIAAGTKQSRHVTFVAFGSEEYGDDGTHHVGSEVFVRRLGPEGREHLAGMTSVDMIADGRPLLVGNSGIADDVVARTLFRKVQKANIAVRYHVLCDCSDHGPFEHAGIPASFMYSGETPEYHSSEDTVANLQPRDVRRTGRAARAFLKDIGPRMIRRFRRH